MDDEIRRRQIEEEMARFEIEIQQVQQALPPPPIPPAVMFIPTQMARAAAPMRPPPMPPMLLPSMQPISHLSAPPSRPSQAVFSAPPVKVYAAPPKKSSEMNQDDIMDALMKAEAEHKEAKKYQPEKPKFVPKPAPIPVPVAKPTTSKDDKKSKKAVRMAGQQVWEDNSLADWDPDDFRIFCGDLGNDVTDDILTRVFAKYPSFTKAKVIRDKRTNKSKGYGFVSFKEPQGFIKAMRELNGKYVGSRPIKLRKSNWNDRNIDVVKKKVKDKQKLGLL